jgi:hypothetical protein
MTLLNNRTRRIVTVKLDNGASQIALIGEVSIPFPLRSVKSKKTDSFRASKLNDSVILCESWLAEERAFEIRRLSAILRNNPTADERAITLDMLAFYQSEEHS